MTTLLLLITVLQILSFTTWGNDISLIIKLNTFLIKDVTTVFLERDSTLITLAAVFIGIYFTAFTLLATISVKSAFSILKRKQFEALLKYTRNAFLVSFSYLLVSLLSPILKMVPWLYTSICILLLTYMLLSALRFGLLIYLILNRDIASYLNKVNDEKLDGIRKERIFNELEKFLEEQSNKNALTKADEISKMLKERKNRKQNNQ
ncbi:hypothetical protein LS684_04210 [Cytobacillus spongiae]|uniref:hypothetical protein n=1 Tax=Cytobacillus spongiae TaxID=2901381 RepID=UPI001F18208F|nr:hypothetical protein [Cytobacillus spongiae]UII56675.1 hypothetical protein LS684_04210 [Cytobacillus spongiae]